MIRSKKLLEAAGVVSKVSSDAVQMFIETGRQNSQAIADSVINSQLEILLEDREPITIALMGDGSYTAGFQLIHTSARRGVGKTPVAAVMDLFNKLESE